MLQSMRHLAQSWVVKGLMIILIASFGIWGIGDMFRGNPLHRAVANSGDKDITVQELNAAFEQTLQRARQTLGPDLTAQQAKQMGMLDSTLNDMIENNLFDQMLKKLGIEADDRAVFQMLVNEPQFKGKDGKFDKALLQSFLADARISSGAFFSQQRKALASRQFVNAITMVPGAPTGLIDALYKARGEKHVFDVLTLNNDSIHDIAVPDDKTLQDFYQKNPQPYTISEMRGMTIATLSTADAAKDITISDDQLKKEYDTKGEQLKEPENRDLLQVVMQDEAQAKSIADAAKASDNLVTAAKSSGHEVIPLNHTEQADLFPELATPIFTLPQGGVTDPIKTSLGWHVMQVRKINVAGVPSFDAIKEKLRQRMKDDQASDTVTNAINQLDDEMAAGKKLETVAESLKMKLTVIPSVDATGKTLDGKEPSVPHKDDVLKQAFAQNSGETSPVMDDKNGNYFIVRTDEVTPSALKPFDQVKPAIIAAWKKQEQVKRAAVVAEDMAKSLREGTTPSKVASKAGADIRQSRAISMLGDSDPSLPKSAMPQIMKLKLNEVTVIPVEDKQLVFRLASVQPSTAEPDEAAEGKIIRELDDSAPRELADQYAKYLRVVFPVTIHHDVVESIVQQGG